MGVTADANYGFKGAVTSAQTPLILGRGVLYSVEGPGDLRVTAEGDGDRAITVAPGAAWGDGVLSIWNTGAGLNGSPVGSGSRWDTVVIRREWTPNEEPTGTATLVLIEGGVTPTISPLRTTDRGVTTSDQPLALVRFDAGSTEVGQIIDLRVWAGAGGGMVALSDSVRQYLDAPGTQVQIGSTQYTRTMVSGSPQWTTADMALLDRLEQVTNTPWGSSPINSNGITGTRRYRIRNGWAVFQFQGQGTATRNNADITVLTFGNPAYRPQEAVYGVVWVGGQPQRAYVNTSGAVHFHPATWANGTTIQAYLTWPVD